MMYDGFLCLKNRHEQTDVFVKTRFDFLPAVLCRLEFSFSVLENRVELGHEKLRAFFVLSSAI
jgi:hypothetical protein